MRQTKVFKTMRAAHRQAKYDFCELLQRNDVAVKVSPRPAGSVKCDCGETAGISYVPTGHQNYMEAINFGHPEYRYGICKNCGE